MHIKTKINHKTVHNLSKLNIGEKNYIFHRKCPNVELHFRACVERLHNSFFFHKGIRLKIIVFKLFIYTTTIPVIGDSAFIYKSPETKFTNVQYKIIDLSPRVTDHSPLTGNSRICGKQVKKIRDEK